MLKAKYKAHKFINLIFYIIVFLIGFYMGSIGKKISFDEIFNKFLMIDNVNALDNNDYNYPSDYTPHPSIGSNGSYKNEEYIYNLFSYFKTYYDLDISFNQIKSVLTYYISNASGTRVYWYFSTSSFVGDISNFSASNFIRIVYHSTNSVPTRWNIQTGSNSNFSSSLHEGVYSNQSGFGNSSLDFSSYYTLDFNPNLFDSFENFKQVCIDPHKPFVLSTNTILNNNKNQSDFLWYPGQFTNLKRADISLNNNSINSFEDFNVNSSYFSNDDMIVKSKDILSSSNVTNYNNIGNINYYGWSVTPFTQFYNTSHKIVAGDITIPDVSFPWDTLYPVYKFDDKFTIKTKSSTGGGITHIDLNDSNNDNLQICFYINNVFDLTNIDIDSYGNYFGTIPTPDGDKDIYIDNTNYNFFGNFHLNDFGLSSILTSPLIAIRSISNGVCEPLNISILGKNITLPCGDTLFWGREDVQTFKIFWNMFFGGILCYGIGLSIFKSIKNFKDPDNDKVEVIDL